LPLFAEDNRREQEPILMRAIIGLNSHFYPRISRPRVLAAVTIVAAALCWMQMAPAQIPATTTQTSTAHKAAHRHKQAAKTAAQQTAHQAAGLPATPPAPIVPLWPANEKPVEAAVTWDSQGLRITAANSSLHQILNDVATATGTTMEGLDTDERIFGVYGPGKARDVLSQLLQGTSYNVLMIGEQGEGTPREIVLSARTRGSGSPAVAANPAPKSDDDEDTDDQPQQQAPPPIRPSFGPHGRTPQDVQQELQLRQQEMERRQQQGQPPQPQPPNNQQ
jgi:hypothetical protein